MTETAQARAPLQSLAARRFDLAVIGGGINGAGIAQEATSRGLRVLLVERDDFGFGTTWRSTKLIHGGLRYLEHGEFRLVFEALHEREALLQLAPSQVQPLAFLLPIYRGYRHRALAIKLGLVLYDLLSWGRRLPGHRRLSAEVVRRLEPSLAVEGLQGAFLYYDAQALYPERLCLEYVLAAQRGGAEVRNHCEAIAIESCDGRVQGLRLRDVLSGSEVGIRARAVVNAAGPWVDAVLERSGRTVPRQIGGTRGSHVMVDYGGRGPRHAIYSEASVDGRPFFIVPWRSFHLIGTTDLRFDGDPRGVVPTDDEIAYLLAEASRRLPTLPLKPQDVLYAYAGIRPLPYTHGEREGSITRRHIIRDHAPDGLAGLYSILGGKLSTFRSLSRQTVERIASDEKLPLAATRRQLAVPFTPSVSPSSPPHLRAVYGPRATEVARLAAQQPELAAPLCRHGETIGAEVVYAARKELAVSLGDVLLRRTGAGWNACLGLDCAATAAHLLASVSELVDEAALVAAYQQEITITFRSPLLSGLGQAQAAGR